MADFVTIRDAEAHLFQLIDRVEGGEELVIVRGGIPVARLVPHRARNDVRQPGRFKGAIWLAEDWDAPETNAEIADLFDR